MRRLLVVLAVTALFGGAARAASFDCNAAKSVRERAICADTKLSAADEQLARAYRDALTAASDSFRIQLRDVQREWLRHVDLVCTDKGQDVAADDIRSCLSGEIDERIAQLKHATTHVGPYLFWQNERLSTERDPDAEEGDVWRYTTKQYEWPQIDATNASASAFNAWVAKRFSLDRKARRPEGDPDADPSTDIWTAITVGRAEAAFIELEVSYSYYGHGAAHPNHGIENVVWLTGPGRELLASDVFTGTGWQETLARLVEAGIKHLRDGDDGWMEHSDMVKRAAEPSHWRIDGKALTVMFDPYEVASYAEGDIEVPVAWADLEPYIARDSAILAELRK